MMPKAVDVIELESLPKSRQKTGFGLGRKDCPQKVRFTSLIAVGIPEP